jgi:polyisoprenoid-binding protein YceI
MRHFFSATIVALVLSFTASAFATSYTVDPYHKTFQFSVRHMGISNVKGTFDKVTGHLDFDEKTPANSKITLDIDPASVNTGNEKRDGHLKSPDFFDVAKYPKLTFVSTKVKAAGKDKYKVTGDLTIHGVTKPITLDVEYLGTQKDPMGTTRAGFTASGKLNRQTYGLTFNKMVEKVSMVGDDVSLSIDLEATKDEAGGKDAATAAAPAK